MHIQWMVTMATRKMSRIAYFFLFRIEFLFGSLHIGTQFTKWYSGRLLEIKKIPMEMKTDYEIEIELTLNVRCSGQNSVFNWFFFIRSSVQFYDNFMVLIYGHSEFKSVILLLPSIAAWAVLVPISTHHKIVVKRKRTKKWIVTFAINISSRVCCKGRWKNFDTKICKIQKWHWFWTIHFYLDRHTFSCWNINFQYFR